MASQRPDDISDKTALFGPGFAGGWAAAREPLAALTVSGGVPADLFAQISAFCADIPEGGAVGGYIGYEAAAALYPDLEFPAAPDSLPVVHLVRYGSVQVREPGFSAAGYITGAVTRPGAADYLPKVTSVIDAILAGEIFQANISRRLSAEFEAVPGLADALFARLVGEHPAKYSAFLPVPGGAVLSNSPELFLEVAGRDVAAEPIKGTMPRYPDPEADRMAAQALETSEKDRAENIMIADLLRNDLAKVCTDHSIREAAICELRSLPHVHHLFSRIEGRLREGLGPIDAVAAAFPCGSITGAPKHRAMQIISRLEGEGRGPYCGTVAFIPASGPAVFSVAIRTAALSVEGTRARLDYRSGGGVTALSDPQAEYEETEAKAYGFEAMLT